MKGPSRRATLAPVGSLVIMLALVSALACSGRGVPAGLGEDRLAPALRKEALFKGIKRLNKKQSSVSIHQSAPDELNEASKATIISCGTRPGPIPPPFMLGSGGGGIWEDALAGKMMQMGYEVVSSDVLRDAEASQRADLLKQMGVQLSVRACAVFALQYDGDTGILSVGPFGGATSRTVMKSSIDSASVRISAGDTGRLLATISLTYKAGRPPVQVAQDMATIITRIRDASRN